MESKTVNGIEYVTDVEEGIEFRLACMIRRPRETSYKEFERWTKEYLSRRYKKVLRLEDKKLDPDFMAVNPSGYFTQVKFVECKDYKTQSTLKAVLEKWKIGQKKQYEAHIKLIKEGFDYSLFIGLKHGKYIVYAKATDE